LNYTDKNGNSTLHRKTVGHWATISERFATQTLLPRPPGLNHIEESPTLLKTAPGLPDVEGWSASSSDVLKTLRAKTRK